MKRHQLEHLLRAAGSVSGLDRVIVIGSQSILGARPDAPEALGEIVADKLKVQGADKIIASLK